VLHGGPGDKASSTLRTIVPFTTMFSASVGWRSQAARNTWLGRSSPSAARSDAGSSRSAGTGSTPSTSVGGRRANAYTSQSFADSSRARLFPMMPLAPTINARPLIVVLLRAVPSMRSRQSRIPGGFDRTLAVSGASPGIPMSRAVRCAALQGRAFSNDLHDIEVGGLDRNLVRGLVPSTSGTRLQRSK
jgi:hypothetical protein